MLIIGELINATRGAVREAILKKDSGYISGLARLQDEAGAHYLDVNVSTGPGNQQREIDDMKWAISVIRDVSEKPLAIDTTSRDVLEAGLRTHGSGAMVNSISAEKGRLESFILLALEHDSLAVVLPIGEEGIPKDVSSRLQVSRDILKVAEREGLASEKLYFDPLAMPLGVDHNGCAIALNTICSFKKELGVKTTIGLSNISHGLPRRGLLNGAFLTLALQKGLDSLIMNPLDKEVMSSLFAANVVLGRDPFCGEYLRAFRRGQFGG